MPEGKHSEMNPTNLGAELDENHVLVGHSIAHDPHVLDIGTDRCGELQQVVTGHCRRYR